MGYRAQNKKIIYINIDKPENNLITPDEIYYKTTLERFVSDSDFVKLLMALTILITETVSPITPGLV